MRTARKNRIVSALLSAVMVLTLVPAAGVPVQAASKPDVDTSETGKYMDAYLGSGASSALLMNGLFADLSASNVPEAGGTIQLGNKSYSVDDYNMMNCFGINRNGNVVSAAVAGFSHSGGQSINAGNTSDKNSGQVRTLNMATYNDKGGESGSMTVNIGANDTLKTLAASGGLEVYFKGYACAGKEKRTAWPDDHTYVNGELEVTYTGQGNSTFTNESGEAKAESKVFGTNGSWITLSANSVITIKWSVDSSAGKFSNGWADRDVGLGDCVLLFRKAKCPNIQDYELTSNGDLSYSESGKPEVLLGNSGEIKLDMNITLADDISKADTVTSSLLGKKVRGSDDYNLLSQLGKRVLFYNTVGTGYTREGEPVYMKLTSAKVPNNGQIENKNIEDNDEKRLEVLQGRVSSLHFEWNAANGDYYGNNPIPTEGDWAGLVSGNNSLNLIDSIVLASFHDLAGNPLKIGGKLIKYSGSNGNYTTNLLYESAENQSFQAGKTYFYNNETKNYTLVESAPGTLNENYYFRRDVLTGKVTLHNKTTSNVGNPFAVNNTASSGYGFVINAVTPTYSKTSNAVQPDVLTGLTLNKGDSFTVALNFSEIVKLRQFNVDGRATGYTGNNLFLKFNNNMTAKYESGLGTKQLNFVVTVPAGDTYNTTSALEIASIFVKSGGKEKTDGILTDYVGNPVKESIGSTTYNTTMAWSGLKVDNTAPGLTITHDANTNSYTITPSDSGSGLYSGGEQANGIVYYVWVQGDQTKAAAVKDAFITNNYEKVKRYSLAPGEDAKVTVDGTTYSLTAVNAPQPIEGKNDGKDWHLLAFTADMTWDSARQLIQYSSSSYKTDPDGYWTRLAKQLGVSQDEMFEQVPTQPDNWNKNYTNYYYKNGSTYSKIPAGTKYPAWADGKFYEVKPVLLERQPGDWTTNYTAYYTAETTDGATVYKHVPRLRSSVPEWKDNTYYGYGTADAPANAAAANDVYVRGTDADANPAYISAYAAYAPSFTEDVYKKLEDGTYTAVGTAEPADWTTKYTNYYYQDPPTYTAVTGGAAPTFEGDTYYLATQALISDTSNWADVFSNYYVLSDGVYKLATSTYSKETTYYTIAESAASTQPDEWASNYTDYAKKNSPTYSPITVEYPSTDVTYYNKQLSELKVKPADWDSSFAYYSKRDDKFESVPRVIAPEWAESTYYKYDYDKLSQEPDNWETVYSQYFYKNKADAYLSAVIDTTAEQTAIEQAGIKITTGAPEFTAGVYQPKSGVGTVKEIANTITDPTRKAAFLEDILKATTAAKKVAVVRRYSEFANDVHKADVDMLSGAADYAAWVRNNYIQDDSNWSWVISDYVDQTAPKVSFTTETNETENVTVTATVTDTSNLKVVKWQFVPAGTEVTVSTVDGWTDVSDVSSVKEKTFSASTAAVTPKLTSGSYDFYVYAEDAARNKSVSRTTVTVNSDVNVTCTISGPSGTSPYSAFTGVTANFSGTVYGVDIFDASRAFTVYAVIDDQATKTADANGWGEPIEPTGVSGTDGVKTYPMPEKTGVSGYYYLHIKYTYKDSAGAVQSGTVINRAYALSGGGTQIIISQSAADTESIIVEISAPGVSGGIQYAVTKTSASQPNDGWQNYVGTLKLKSADYDESYGGAVRVWAKAGELVRSEDFNLNGSSQTSGVVAAPSSLTLLDVGETSGGSRYAVVRFDGLGDALSIGAEYSVSANNGGWLRWMPLDSMVRVSIPNGTPTLRFKFRNGDNVTAESGYARLTVNSDPNQAWTIATRSTLRTVDSTKGVTVSFTTSDNSTVEPAKVETNGVYTQDGLTYVVSNINNNPPSYKLTWSDSGYHVTASSVVATVTSDETITVTALKFTPDGGSVTTMPPARSYLFKKNGTAVFTIKNEAGNKANVTANVTWLDTEPLTLKVTKNYDGFKTYGSDNDLIANGAKLIVKPSKLLAQIEVNGESIADTHTYDVSRNGTYRIVATDLYGTLVTEKVTVSNIVTSIDAPKVTTALSADKKTVTATITGTADTKNPVYDGKKVSGSPLRGSYTFPKTYTRNGTYTEYLTDSVGNMISYQVSVTQFDETAPVIALKDNQALSMNKNAVANDKVTAWIKENLSITDNVSATENITVTLSGTTVDTSAVGAYTVIVTAKDEAGNQSYLRTSVYVLPTDGMLITDEHGVLFCSSSKDAALVNRNGKMQVKLTVSRYDLMALTGASGVVYNKQAKITVTVKQGAYREGQMKYFNVLSKDQIVYNSNRTATVTLNVSDLPGTGWYTVIIRNAEREREFTTFFINADH